MACKESVQRQVLKMSQYNSCSKSFRIFGYGAKSLASTQHFPFLVSRSYLSISRENVSDTEAVGWLFAVTHLHCWEFNVVLSEVCDRFGQVPHLRLLAETGPESGPHAQMQGDVQGCLFAILKGTVGKICATQHFSCLPTHRRDTRPSQARFSLTFYRNNLYCG